MWFSDWLLIGQEYQFTGAIEGTSHADTKFTGYIVDENNVILAKVFNSSLGAKNIHKTFVPTRPSRLALAVESSTAQTVTIANPCLSLSQSGYQNGQYKPYMTDSVEWETQTLWGAGTASDVLYADHIDVNIGAYTFGDNTPIRISDWKPYEGTYAVGLAATLFPKAMGNNVRMLELDTLPYASVGDGHQVGICGNTDATSSYTMFIRVPTSIASSDTELRAWLNGKTVYYELATPTTTPISPALPMSYKVEQGGTESIIVPEGEISAAPLLTVAESESASELVMDALAAIATPDGPTATANHAANTYLTMGGKLYKVTTAIASGEQIVSGTNVTETTVMAEVLSLIQ